MPIQSKEHFRISGREVAARVAERRPIITMDAADVPNYESLSKVGVGFSPAYLQAAASAYAMDDVSGGVFTPSISTPVRFLQSFLPGFVHAAFAARKIDEFIGISTVAKWFDEEVVQGRLENMGSAVPYTDASNVPFGSYNVGFETRTVVRFEMGAKVGTLESERAGSMLLDAAATKRIAAELALEIARNNVGFYGYNDGASRTYGLLNDPSLPAYATVAAVSGVTAWSGKNFDQICADLRQGFLALESNSQGAIDVASTDIVLGLPVGYSAYMSVTSPTGQRTVREWLAEAYPRCRIVMAPQLAAANGGSNVFYLYAEEVNDGATDDRRVWVQPVPAKFMALGVERTSKAVIEDYTNATAGAMLKRPYAVYRATGI